MGPAEALIKYALQWVNTPYKWGGDDFSGIDCSGYVQEILAAAGEDPPQDQTAQALFNYFDRVGIKSPRNYALSLAFFGKSATKISHVAFCINQYQMIESGGGGSRTHTRDDAIRDNGYVRMRLIRNRSDLVSIIRPLYTKLNLI